MSLPVFNFPVDANNAARTNSYRTKSVQYGDGYKQLAPAGINNKLDTWDLTLPLLTNAVVAQIEAFCDGVGQHKNFNWTPPRGALGVYRFTSPIKYQAQGLDRSGTTRTTVVLSIEKVYLNTLINTLPVVSIAANSLIGWTITRTGDTTNPLTISYTLTVTPGSVTIGTLTIPVGTSTASIQLSNASGVRTEVIAITSGLEYTIGSPDHAEIIISGSIGNILSLKFEGTSIADDNNRSITNNNVVISTSKFFAGSSSGLFVPNTHPQLSVDLSSAPIIGSGDFTIKFAVNFNNVTTSDNQYIFDFGFNRYRFAMATGLWSIYDGAAGLILGYTQMPVVGTWYEIAICRSTIGASRTERMYFNGNVVASTPDHNIILNDLQIYIGHTYPGYQSTDVYLNAYLDNFAISNFAEFT
jgi:phage-related protein